MGLVSTGVVLDKAGIIGHVSSLSIGGGKARGGRKAQMGNNRPKKCGEKGGEGASILTARRGHTCGSNQGKETPCSLNLVGASNGR